jgi:fructose-bisphosphate aldolase, class I
MDKAVTIASRLMQQGKGILAADESSKTANSRLESVGVEPTEENRRRYRDLLLTTPGIENYLSGVILYDETIKQSALDGTPFPELLTQKKILVGIKVDEGLEDFEGGQVTKGLDGLAERLNVYKQLGATFTKWRAVIPVGARRSLGALKETSKRMAEYAHIVQEFHMVPIVEPEVLMEGDHSAEDAEGSIIEALGYVFDSLQTTHIQLPAVILKTSMAVSGKDAVVRAESSEVARRTVDALTKVVPKEVGGIVFLSGGQTPEEATENLNAIARLEPHPWPITFSFARALQAPALEEWSGRDEQYDEAQAMFLKRIMLAVSADAGGYTKSQENPAF